MLKSKLGIKYCVTIAILKKQICLRMLSQLCRQKVCICDVQAPCFFACIEMKNRRYKNQDTAVGRNGYEWKTADTLNRS
jgi:hypothetical protein